MTTPDDVWMRDWLALADDVARHHRQGRVLNVDPALVLRGLPPVWSPAGAQGPADDVMTLAGSALEHLHPTDPLRPVLVEAAAGCRGHDLPALLRHVRAGLDERASAPEPPSTSSRGRPGRAVPPPGRPDRAVWLRGRHARAVPPRGRSGTGRSASPPSETATALPIGPAPSEPGDVPAARHDAGSGGAASTGAVVPARRLRGWGRSARGTSVDESTRRGRRLAVVGGIAVAGLTTVGLLGGARPDRMDTTILTAEPVAVPGRPDAWVSWEPPTLLVEIGATRYRYRLEGAVEHVRLQTSSEPGIEPTLRVEAGDGQWHLRVPALGSQTTETSGD